jgi:hypothetical protein
MKPENTAYLEVHRGIWTMYEKAQIVVHIDEATKQGLLRVIHEEFDSAYLVNLWCGACVVDMLKYVYTQYEQWLQAQAKIKS